MWNLIKVHVIDMHVVRQTLLHKTSDGVYKHEDQNFIFSTSVNNHYVYILGLIALWR